MKKHCGYFRILRKIFLETVKSYYILKITIYIRKIPMGDQILLFFCMQTILVSVRGAWGKNGGIFHLYPPPLCKLINFLKIFRLWIKFNKWQLMILDTFYGGTFLAACAAQCSGYRVTLSSVLSCMSLCNPVCTLTYLSNICTIFAQYLHNICTIFLHFL